MDKPDVHDSSDPLSPWVCRRGGYEGLDMRLYLSMYLNQTNSTASHKDAGLALKSRKGMSTYGSQIGYIVTRYGERKGGWFQALGYGYFFIILRLLLGGCCKSINRSIMQLC